MGINLDHQSATIADVPADLDYHVDGQSVLTGTLSQATSLTLWVNGQSFVQIKGHVPRLVIKLVDGQSKVLLDGLVADDVQMLERLDGQSNLSVATSNSVSFADKIDGASGMWIWKVGAAVAGGRCTFKGKIDGKSHVQIVVDNPNANYFVEFRDKIDGKATVDLFNQWFTVTGPEVSGSSQVSYTDASQPPSFAQVHFGAAVTCVPNLLPMKPD